MAPTQMHKEFTSSDFEAEIQQTTMRKLAKLYPGEHASWSNRKHWAKKNDVQWDERLSSFKGFLLHLGRKPSDNHSLDRIKPTGAYLLENLRWADKFQQTHNRTNSLSVAAYGRDWPLQLIAARLNITYQAAYQTYVSQGACALRRNVTARTHELTFEFPCTWKSHLDTEYSKDSQNVTKLDWLISETSERRHIVMQELGFASSAEAENLRLELQNIYELLLYGEAYRRWAKHQEMEEAMWRPNFPLDVDYIPAAAPRFKNGADLAKYNVDWIAVNF